MESTIDTQKPTDGGLWTEGALARQLTFGDYEPCSECPVGHELAGEVAPGHRMEELLLPLPQDDGIPAQPTLPVL